MIIFLLISLNCVARATLWFCSVFFSYAADLSLFLETCKGLTCAAFTESVDLRPDWRIWHYILESSVELLPGAKKDGFCLSSSQSLWCAKWSGLYSLCQRGVSEVVQPAFRFTKPRFCFRVESSVLAGKQAGTTSNWRWTKIYKC